MHCAQTWGWPGQTQHLGNDHSSVLLTRTVLYLMRRHLNALIGNGWGVHSPEPGARKHWGSSVALSGHDGHLSFPVSNGAKSHACVSLFRVVA